MEGTPRMIVLERSILGLFFICLLSLSRLISPLYSEITSVEVPWGSISWITSATIYMVSIYVVYLLFMSGNEKYLVGVWHFGKEIGRLISNTDAHLEAGGCIVVQSLGGVDCLGVGVRLIEGIEDGTLQDLFMDERPI